MIHRVSNLSPDQRAVLEGLIGRTFEEGASVRIEPTRVIKEAPTGEARKIAHENLMRSMDRIAEKAKGVDPDELEAAIEEVCEYVRHNP